MIWKLWELKGARGPYTGLARLNGARQRRSLQISTELSSFPGFFGKAFKEVMVTNHSDCFGQMIKEILVGSLS